MKIIDGLKLKGRPAEIPDCSKDDIPQFFADMGFKTGVEIGVYKGEFREKFCKAGLKMFAIDPWIGYRGAGRSQMDQSRQDFLYGHAQRLLASYDNCTIIMKTSMDAVNDFENESLDFVYIDGNHSFPFVAEDIHAWYWKVKKGGVVSGHDYYFTFVEGNGNLNNVRPIVNAFAEAFRIENFYVIASELDAKSHKCFNWVLVKK